MSDVIDIPELTDEEKAQANRIFNELKLRPAADYTQDERREALEKITQARVKMLFRYPFWGQLALSFRIVDGTDWIPIPTAGTNGYAIYIHAGFVNMLTVEQCIFLLAHEMMHVMYDHFGRQNAGTKRHHKLWNIAGDYVINLVLVKENIGQFIDLINIYVDRKYDGWTTEEIYDDLPYEIVYSGMFDFHMPGAPGSTEHIRKGIIEAAQTCSTDQMPAIARGIIKDLTEPEMSWNELIDVTLTSSIKDDFTWLRTSRKAWHLTAILPGNNDGMAIDVAIAIDTSGSITDDMTRKFLSEVQGIMDQFDQYRLTIWQYDTRYYGLDVFTNDDGRDISEYKIVGGGGTDFDAIFRCMVDNEIEPDQLIVFTDGCTINWGDDSYCDTLFVINNRHPVTPPYGQSVHFR